MAGLMTPPQQPGMQQEQPGMQQPGGQPMMPQGEPEGEESNVTPEEQEEYNEFVTNGMALIYDEKAMPQLLQSIEGDGNPIEGLANALVTVVTRLEDSANDQGREFSGDVKLHATTELMEQMVELAEQAGIHEYSEEEMESALYLAMDLYRSARQEEGTLPVDELSEDMGMLMQADQEGRLDEVVPGVSEYAQRAPKPEDVDPEAGGEVMNNQRR